jgi:uncharacterized protein (TIGR02246 family)
MIVELAIQDVVARLAAAWNDQDWAGFSEFFAEDADYVTGAGVRISGRAHIRAHLSSLSEGSPPPDKVALKIDSVKLLASDFALVLCSWQTVGNRQPREGCPARAGVITMVGRATRDRWEVVALHNTDRRR